MKKSNSFIFLFCLMGTLLFSQKDLNDPPPDDGRKPKEKEKKDWNWREKFYFGGNFGAWFGTQTYIDISPLVGYKITDKFSVGVGAIYNYYSSSYMSSTGSVYKYKTSMYGGRCFARYFILDNVFAQIGWDRINRNDPFSYGNERIWVDNYLVGGGVRYPIGDRIYCTAVGLWNLNYSAYSPYPNPILQIGFVGRF